MTIEDAFSVEWWDRPEPTTQEGITLRLAEVQKALCLQLEYFTSIGDIASAQDIMKTLKEDWEAEARPIV